MVARGEGPGHRGPARRRGSVTGLCSVAGDGSARGLCRRRVLGRLTCQLRAESGAGVDVRLATWTPVAGVDTWKLSVHMLMKWPSRMKLECYLEGGRVWGVQSWRGA